MKPTVFPVHTTVVPSVPAPAVPGAAVPAAQTRTAESTSAPAGKSAARLPRAPRSDAERLRTLAARHAAPQAPQDDYSVTPEAKRIVEQDELIHAVFIMPSREELKAFALRLQQGYDKEVHKALSQELTHVFPMVPRTMPLVERDGPDILMGRLAWESASHVIALTQSLLMNAGVIAPPRGALDPSPVITVAEGLYEIILGKKPESGADAIIAKANYSERLLAVIILGDKLMKLWENVTDPQEPVARGQYRRAIAAFGRIFP